MDKFYFPKEKEKMGRWVIKEIEEKTKKICPKGSEEK
jgi:hypothetical protein